VILPDSVPLATVVVVIAKKQGVLKQAVGAV
jgi:hypothetical protein